MSPAARSRLTPLALMTLALAVAALLFIALSPGASGTPATASASAAAKTVKIDIKNYAYSKKTVTVKVGQKITWTNRDDMKHDVTPDKSAAGAPKGPLLAKGKSYTFTATKKGTFKYHCSPHPYMHGTVVVK